MAIQLPLIFEGTRIKRLPGGDTISGAGAIITRTNNHGSAIVIGQPVFASGPGSVGLALASSLISSRVIGMVGEASISDGADGSIITSGAVTATEAEWDAVTGGSGGLIATSAYYLDPDTAGMITDTPPSVEGDVVVRLGTADDTTSLILNIELLVLL